MPRSQGLPAYTRGSVSPLAFIYRIVAHFPLPSIVVLGCLALLVGALYYYSWAWINYSSDLRPFDRYTMRRPELQALISSALVLGPVQAQSSILLPSSSLTSTQASTTSFRSILSVPPSAGTGAPLIPNIQDPQAVDPQTVCPGYTASNVVSAGSRLAAQLSLAGRPCNVYGNDINELTLTVEYQAKDRLHVEVAPTYLDASNASQYIIEENLLRKPKMESNASSTQTPDLEFTWSNDPTFSFTVKRQSTNDILFSTAGKKLVFEDQFIEFGSDLPEDYNLYGLGETIRGFRLGNNLTRTLYNADVGDLVDQYGSLLKVLC